MRYRSHPARFAQISMDGFNPNSAVVDESAVRRTSPYNHSFFVRVCRSTVGVQQPTGGTRNSVGVSNDSCTSFYLLRIFESTAELPGTNCGEQPTVGILTPGFSPDVSMIYIDSHRGGWACRRRTGSRIPQSFRRDIARSKILAIRTPRIGAVPTRRM
jgi:hypothetical protein